MPKHLWLLCVCVLTSACERHAGDVTVEAESAALLGHDHRGHHGWHRFRKPAHCRAAEDDVQPVCSFATYDSGLQGAPASFVFFDTRVRGVAYAVSGGSIWQSKDSGETWSPRGDTQANIISLAADGTDEGALIATTGSGIQVSRDEGANWSSLSLSGLPVELLDRAAVQPQRVYTTVDHGPLLVSMDEGEHWEMAGVNYPPRGDTYGLSVDPRDPLDVVAALQFYRADAPYLDGHGTLIRSRDGGVTWHIVYDANLPVHHLVRCPVNPSLLLAGTGNGVARSFDGGDTWSLIPIATQQQGTRAVVVNPQDCDDFYALQDLVGPLHTRDGGGSFSTPLVQGLQLTATGAYPGTLAIDPEDATHLILSTHGGFYSSHDSGEHWSMLPVMLFMNVTALAVSPSNPSEVWLASWGQGVWKRSGENVDWQRIGIDRLPRDYIASLTLDPRSARAVIGADPAMFSQDGETFSQLPTNSTVLSAIFHPSDPQIIYLSTQLSGVYKSVDGGLSWQSANGNLPHWSGIGDGIDARALAMDPARPEQLFLATYGRGIFRSDDAAVTWTQLLNSPEFSSCLVLVSAATPKLYACLSGVTASEDGGQTWKQLNNGLPSLSVTQLLHDPVSDKLYASTSRGVFVLQAGDDSWQALDEGCDGAVRGMAFMEEAGRRYLVVGAEHGVRRRAL